MFQKSKAVQDIDELEARFFQKLPKALQLFPEPQPQKRRKGVQLDLVCVIPHKPPMQYWIFLGKPSTLSTPFTTKDYSLAHWLWSYGHQRLNEVIRPRWSSPHLSYSSSFSPFPLQEVESQVTQPALEGRALLVREKSETQTMHRLVNCRFTAWLQISSVQIKKCMLGSLHGYVLVSSPSHSFCPRSTVSLPVSWRKKKTIWFRWRLFYKGAPTGQQSVSSCLWLRRNSLQPLFQWLPASPYIVHSILFNIGHPVLLSLTSVSFLLCSTFCPQSRPPPHQLPAKLWESMWCLLKCRVGYTFPRQCCGFDNALFCFKFILN